jgi:2-amino-4-hydroxy-6-hydroxymethyldihydropteridine diphosphokinase
MNEAYLCLGGNLGNSFITFKEACGHIEQQVGDIKLRSSMYQSHAWGMDNAPDFYNQVIKIETKLMPEELMLALLDIEKTLGRERKESGTSYQNRVIDIDVLFYKEDAIKTDTLEIPHPRLHLRKFVLEPLNEIAPNYIHPLLHKSVSELLALCIDKGQIKKLEHAI